MAPSSDLQREVCSVDQLASFSEQAKAGKLDKSMVINLAAETGFQSAVMMELLLARPMVEH